MKYILAVTKQNKVVVVLEQQFEHHKDTLNYIGSFPSRGEAFRFSLEHL